VKFIVRSRTLDFPTQVWRDAPVMSSLDFFKKGIRKSGDLSVIIPILSDTPQMWLDWGFMNPAISRATLKPCQNDLRDCLGWNPVKNWQLPQRHELRTENQPQKLHFRFVSCCFWPDLINSEYWLALICPTSCYVIIVTANQRCSVERSEAAPSRSRHRCQLREGKDEWGKWSWTINNYQKLEYIIYTFQGNWLLWWLAFRCAGGCQCAAELTRYILRIWANAIDSGQPTSAGNSNWSSKADPLVSMAVERITMSDNVQWVL
jgi:hypothetical protein